MKFLLIVVSILFVYKVQAEDRFANVEIKTHKVAKNIYMLQGEGGNIGVSVGDDGVYLIDDQFAPLNKKILAAVSKLSKKPIRFVINTHWHADHTGGNELMGKAGVEILAHDNVRKRMSVENFNKVFNRKTPPAPQKALPTVTFPDKMSIHLNGEEAQVIHFANAHTDGDAIIYFKKSNVIHTGDIFFNGYYPFIDVDSKGSMKGLIKAVRSILKIADTETKIIPGHGLLATKKDLQNYLEMLTSVDVKVAKLMKQGKSLEQVVAEKPTAELDAQWGKGFMKPEVFTRIAYRSLSKKK